MPLARQLRDCPAGLDRFFDRALSKDPDKRFPDGAAFREAFQNAGKQLSPDRLDQTVVDADTVASAPAPNQPLRAGPDGRPVATSPGPGRRQRGRYFGLTLAALAILSVGLATAAYLRLSRPLFLKADDRERPASHPAAVSGGRQVPPREEAMHHEESVRQEKAGNPGKAVTQPRVASMEVEPVAAPLRIPRNVRVTVPAGTEISLTLDMAVGSSSSHAGDSFTGKTKEPVVAGDRVAIPAGSSVHGRVSEAIPAKKGLRDKVGSLSLSFDRVVTPTGAGAPMSAAMTTVASKSGKKTAGIIGGSAAGGALLGKILGGSTKNAAVGSVVGGAIGTGIASGTRGEDVELPAGSPLTIKLDQPLTISVSP